MTIDFEPDAGAAAATIDFEPQIDFEPVAHGTKTITLQSTPDPVPKEPIDKDLAQLGEINQPQHAVTSPTGPDFSADALGELGGVVMQTGNTPGLGLGSFLPRPSTHGPVASGAASVLTAGAADLLPDRIRKPVVSAVAGGIRGGENLVEGLTTPFSVGLMPLLGGAPGIIQKAAGAVFAGQAIKGAGEALSAATESDSVAEIAQHLTEGIGSLGMAGMILGHTAGRPSGRSHTAELAEAAKKLRAANLPATAAVIEKAPPEPPPAEPPAAPAPEPPKPPVTIAGPVLLESFDSGKVIGREGKIGEDHVALRKELTAAGIDATEAVHGFKDSEGNSVTRADAYKIAEAAGQLNEAGKRKRARAEAKGEVPELDSQDLMEAAAPPPVVETPAPEPASAPAGPVELPERPVPPDEDKLSGSELQTAGKEFLVKMSDYERQLAEWTAAQDPKKPLVFDHGTVTRVVTPNIASADVQGREWRVTTFDAESGEPTGHTLHGSREQAVLVAKGAKGKLKVPEISVGKTVSDAVMEHGSISDAHEALQARIDNPETPAAEKKRLIAAQKELEAIAQKEYLRQQSEEGAEEADRENHELIASVKAMGGLPTLKEKGAEATGELGRVIESKPGAFLSLFRKGAKSLDTIREALNELGFNFETGYDVLAAIEDSLTTGRKVYGRGDTSGMPFGPGKMTVGELPPQQTTGLKKAVVKEERIARGLDDLPPAERQSEEERVIRAEDATDADETLASSLIARIVDDGVTAISADEAAILLVERNRVMNERRAWEDRANQEGDTSPGAIEQAKKELDTIENKLERLDRAQRAAGSQWGRTGRMYQRLINEDFTLAEMERRARAAKGAPLDEGERAKIAEQAAEIERLQKDVEGKAEADRLAAEREAVNRVHEATIKDLQTKAAAQPKYGKEVFDIARTIVDRWKKDAEEARRALRKAMGQTNIGVDPTIVLHLAKIMRAKIGEFGLDFTEAAASMIAELGAEIQPYLKKAWIKAQGMINKEKVSPKVKASIKAGVTAPKKGEKTPVDIKARAKAEATAGEDLSHKTVYDLARAHINAGLRGDAVMEAVHKDILEFFPGATERDVRRAYSEYGKVKFPSKDADKTLLRELRAMVRMQESIDRLKEGLAPLHSGLQRDKATQAVREKQAELNELLKKHTGPPSPEKLASRDEARKTALRNQIEDLDKRLRTGIKPGERVPLPDSPEVQRMKAERDAMRAKLDEIEADPKKTPEERYNAARAKQIARELAETEARIKANDYGPRAKKESPPLSNENLDARARLAEKKNEVRRGEEQYRLANRTRAQKIWDGIRQAKLGFTNILSSYDVSAPRQGLVYLLTASSRLVTNPAKGIRMLARPFGDMFRALSDEVKAQRIQQKLDQRPNRLNGVDKLAGVQFQDIDNTSFTRGEENAHSILDEWAKTPLRTGNLAKDIALGPAKLATRGVRASNRAFTTFLNVARAELLDTLLADNFKDRPPTPAELKQVGDMVNLATGRGNMSPGVRNALGWSGLWSPNLLVSRVQLMVGQPLWKGSARTRRIVAEEYARIIATGAVLYGVSRLFDSKDETDSTSSDFAKIVREGATGDTRIDLWGGFQQVTVLASRMAQRKTKTIDDDEKDLSGRELLLTGAKFYRSKLRPDVGIAANIVLGEDWRGRPSTVGNVAQSLAPIPISLSEITKLLKAHGFTEGMILQTLQEFGVGVSNYADDDYDMRSTRQ